MIVKLDKTKPHQKYFVDGKEVVGASTIAKVNDDSQGALMHWAWKQGQAGLDYRTTRDKAADAGDVGHFLIHCHFMGYEPDLSLFDEPTIEFGKTVFEKFLVDWEKSKLTFVSSELQLTSQPHRYGGTLDVVGRDPQDRLCLVDEKSCKYIYEAHLFQLSGYEQLYNENHEEQIERRAIFRNGKEKKGDTELLWLEPLEDYFQVFLVKLALYNAERSLVLRLPKRYKARPLKKKPTVAEAQTDLL
jgi:hypothetical protein